MAAEAGHIPPSDSILFILVCFSVGVLIRLGLKWTKIPYTAMLLVSPQPSRPLLHVARELNRPSSATASCHCWQHKRAASCDAP